MQDEKTNIPPPISNKWQKNLDDAGSFDNEAAAIENPPPEEPEGIKTAELIKPVVDFALAVLCPNWPDVQKQSDALADSYGLLLDKYFPDMASSAGVEINALLITAAIFAPPVLSGIPRKLPAPKKSEGDNLGERVTNETANTTDKGVS